MGVVPARRVSALQPGMFCRVEVARFRHDEAVLRAGLRAGDKLVVSVLSPPVAGMKLRAMEAEHSSADAGMVTESLPARRGEP